MKHELVFRKTNKGDMMKDNKTNIRENKPKKWQICTIDNTKIGDVVKYKESCKKFTVSFFSNTGQTFLLRKECGIDNNHMSTISDYEIKVGDKE